MQVKVEKFEGPLSLLLRLIEKEEMDITQISLASVADQYVEFIKKSESINPEGMADFLVIAAKLLYIKSRALLPYLYPEEDVDEDIEELEKQLKMYKEFLEASRNIEEMIGKKKFMFAREFNRKVSLKNIQTFSPPKKIDKEQLKEAFNNLLARNSPVEELREEKMEDKINIEDKIDSIRKDLIKKVSISFNKLMKSSGSKTEVVVSFLAVLEMMRQREATLSQDEMFGDILIKSW